MVAFCSSVSLASYCAIFLVYSSFSFMYSAVNFCFRFSSASAHFFDRIWTTPIALMFSFCFRVSARLSARKRKNGVSGFFGRAGISNFSSIDLMAEIFAAGTKGDASLKMSNCGLLSLDHTQTSCLPWVDQNSRWLEQLCERHHG